ncbi:MAG: hypothetical protein OXU23_01360 [Candidatus Poribacteria bacterium]|nr:hypothetical protein [Candidatus Poribacteria bacterium]
MNKSDISKASRPEKESAIAEILKENPKATRAEITELTGIPDSTVFHILQKIKGRTRYKIREALNIVYAWRWSGDSRYAKIGKTTIGGLEGRMVKTYHPTDDPVLIAIMPCSSEGQASENHDYFLNQAFERTRPDREWVFIDAGFREEINDLCISDPNVLSEMFNGRIKTETLLNEGADI